MFEAGTTNEVASITQVGLECEDAELEAALQAALSAKP